MRRYRSDQWELLPETATGWDVYERGEPVANNISNEDDARLIAAAPDMLVMLDWVWDVLDHYDKDGAYKDILTQIEQVTKKARGE